MQIPDEVYDQAYAGYQFCSGSPGDRLRAAIDVAYLMGRCEGSGVEWWVTRDELAEAMRRRTEGNVRAHPTE